MNFSRGSGYGKATTAYVARRHGERYLYFYPKTKTRARSPKIYEYIISYVLLLYERPSYKPREGDGLHAVVLVPGTAVAGARTRNIRTGHAHMCRVLLYPVQFQQVYTQTTSSNNSNTRPACGIIHIRTQSGIRHQPSISTASCHNRKFLRVAALVRQDPPRQKVGNQD